MKKRKGVALIIVVGVFTLIFMFITIMTTYTMQNAMAARRQEERVRAYYLVQAGMEIGRYGVTKSTGYRAEEVEDGVVVKEAMDITILNLAKEDPKTILNYDVEEGILVPDGVIKLRLTATDEEGNPWAGKLGEDEVWVEIYAVGTITNKSGQQTSHAGRLRICADNPAKTVRIVDNPLDF